MITSRFKLFFVLTTALFMASATTGCEQVAEPEPAERAERAQPAERAAEQYERVGDHVVHYNTVSTSKLPPEVAREYGIQRSDSRALLNVAVLKKSEQDNGLDTPVTADVSASAVNLAGQRREIRMQEITEDDAIYYIGTFRIHDEEVLDFTIRVRPEGAERRREITFRQKFYID